MRRVIGMRRALAAASVGSYTGLCTSLALSPDVRPAISYLYRTARTLDYIVYDGLSWKRTTIDDAGLGNIRTSLAFIGGSRDQVVAGRRVPPQEP